MTTRRSAALDAFADGDPPAFATDARQRVRFWNDGAEQLLGGAAEQQLGKPCFEVLRGRDVFGNRFCYENCPLQAAQRRGEHARPFELIVPARDGAGALRVTAVQLGGDSAESFMLLHILAPAARAPRDAASEPSHREPPLTEREQQVLRGIADGLHNKEMAERLRISPATVRNHVHHVLDKLRVHSKLQAAALAYRSGWTDGA